MEATAEPSVDEDECRLSLHSESLSLVDLRLLSQSELFSLALSASSAPHSSQDDVIIPKIDRSVFNESAGSRKQTFSRLRLAPRNKRPPKAPTPPVLASHIPLDVENTQIINLLQQLFGVESLRTPTAAAGSGGGVLDAGLVSVQVDFKQPESGALPYQNIPIDVVDEGSTGKRKRGRPRKNQNSLALVVRNEVEPPPRPEKKAKVKDDEGLVEDGGGGVDPISEEVKRRTMGIETEAQLVELLDGLKGEWVSQRKKRKVVETSDLGPFLPNGWKVVLCLMKRAGRASVVCRRYVSPYGPEFESFKEVSAYLLSFYGEDINLLKSNYTDGSLQFSSNTNVASGSVVCHVPTGGMMTEASASCLRLPSTSVPTHHEKQAIVSSLIGNEKINSSNGNFNSSLPWGCKLGDTSSEAFGDFNCQSEDKQPMMDDKHTANSVQEYSFEQNRVHNQKMADTVDAACNLYIPLVFSTPFPNNNSGVYPLSDEINPVTCRESGISNFASENRNTGCPVTTPSGNNGAHVDNNGHGLSFRLVEDQRHKVGFESRILSPNSEGKMFAGSNLEDRHLISSQEDMKISDGNLAKDGKQQIILQNSLDGFSFVSSQKGLDHVSITSSDWIQNFMPEDDVAKCFDGDLSIGESTWASRGYIRNDSLSTCTKDASEFGGVYIVPNLSVEKDVSDSHAPPNEEFVMSFAQERNSLSDQNCAMDSLLHPSSKSNWLTPTGDEHSSGTFDALKAVDADCNKPQSGIVSCGNDGAVDAYTNASIMQGRSQGFESVALAGSVLNQFDMQSNYSVNSPNKSCLSENAKSEQVDILHTNPTGMPGFR